MRTGIILSLFPCNFDTICSSRCSFAANTSFHRRESNKIISFSKLLERRSRATADAIEMIFPWLRQIYLRFDIQQPRKNIWPKANAVLFALLTDRWNYASRNIRILHFVSARYGFGLWLGSYWEILHACSPLRYTAAIYFGGADWFHCMWLRRCVLMDDKFWFHTQPNIIFGCWNSTLKYSHFYVVLK